MVLQAMVVTYSISRMHVNLRFRELKIVRVHTLDHEKYEEDAIQFDCYEILVEESYLQQQILFSLFVADRSRLRLL
jgi:hypothetical protein